MDITTTATSILNSTPMQYAIATFEAIAFSIGMLLTGDDSEPGFPDEDIGEDNEDDAEHVVYSPDSLFF